MLLAFITFAAEEGVEPSKTPFYVVGAVLAVYAVVLAALGIRKHDFPGTEGAARGVIALTVLLVAATLASAVLTS